MTALAPRRSRGRAGHLLPGTAGPRGRLARSAPPTSGLAADAALVAAVPGVTRAPYGGTDA